MLRYILCIFIGALVGMFSIAIVSGNRPDDEYWDGYQKGYEEAKDKFSKLP